MKKLSFLTRVSLLLGFFFTLDKLLAFARTIIILRQFQLSSELDLSISLTSCQAGK